MGSLPYESHPRDDTKGGARPPLETPVYLMNSAPVSPVFGPQNNIAAHFLYNAAWG